MMDFETTRDEMEMTGTMEIEMEVPLLFMVHGFKIRQISWDESLDWSSIVDPSHTCTTTLRATSKILRHRLGLYGD